MLTHRCCGRCIGRWLAERSATCPLCKTELWDEEEEDSSDEEEEAAAPAASNNTNNGWRQLVDLLSFNLEGGHENLVTANRQASQEQQQAGNEAETAASGEPSWWHRIVQRARGRTLAEQHGVTLNALTEPLLQAENGQIDSASGTAEPRPDPPEGGSPSRE